MRTTHNRNYQGTQLGQAIRGSINKERIFRVRPGNGAYTANLGEVYQDQYTYFVPDSITNVEGQGARDTLTQAVINWQAFSDDEKKAYNYKATKAGLQMSGYNLYLREYIKANA